VFSGHTRISIDPTTFDIPEGGSQTFTIIVSDEVGAALVGGSTITVSATNATVSPTSFTIPENDADTSHGPVPGLTQFTVVLTNPTTPAPSASPGPATPPQTATLTVDVNSPIEVGADCPGGNGNATLTITGTIE